MNYGGSYHFLSQQQNEQLGTIQLSPMFTNIDITFRPQCCSKMSWSVIFHLPPSLYADNSTSIVKRPYKREWNTHTHDYGNLQLHLTRGVQNASASNKQLWPRRIHTDDIASISGTTNHTSRSSSSSSSRYNAVVFDEREELDRNQLYHQWDTQGDARSYGSSDYAFALKDDLEYPRACYRAAMADRQYPICNILHQMPLINSMMSYSTYDDVTYISRGYFRDTWKYSEYTNSHNDGSHMMKAQQSSWILKTIRMMHEIDTYAYRFVQKEATIMESLTSSPRIVDIYGLCGVTIVAEHMAEEITTQIVPGPVLHSKRGLIQQSELDVLQEQDVHPMNNLTIVEKLDIAIIMTESIADVHGHRSGVIVHGDIHPDQWLRNTLGQIKRTYMFQYERNKYFNLA
jgi:hypothetical protein